MKKIILSLSSLVTIALLSACQNQPQSENKFEIGSSADAFTATLIVTFDDETVSKEVVFDADDSVMDILEEYHDVEEDQGMVTAIDGVSQDAAAKTYWMYKINDEMAPKGAEEMTISDGDTVEFYLETFE